MGSSGASSSYRSGPAGSRTSSRRGLWVVAIVLPVVGALAVAFASGLFHLNPCGSELVSSERPLDDGGRALLCGDDPALQREVIVNEDGDVTEEITLREGERQGDYTRFDPEGGVLESGTYVDGRRDGVFTVFFPGGRTASITTYRDGFRHGSFQEWHKGGLLKTRGEFAHDSPKGEWEAYDPEGAPIKSPYASQARVANPIGNDVIFGGRTLAWWNKALKSAGLQRREGLIRAGKNAGLEIHEDAFRLSLDLVAGYDERRAPAP